MQKLKKFKTQTFSILFIISLLFLCRLVFLYGDDYFYGQFTKNGAAEFFRSHAGHYMKTNGRAIIHLLVSVTLYFDVYLWRILNPFMIFFTIFFAAKNSTTLSGKCEEDVSRNDIFYPLVLSASLFLCFDIDIMRETVLWLDGSFNYLFPLLLIFSAHHIFNKSLLQTIEKKYGYLPALCFFAGATTEQSGIMAVGLLIICLVSHIIKKSNIKFIHILSLFAAIAGYLTVMLSPGIIHRFGIDGTFFSLENIHKIFYFFMTQNVSGIFISLTVSGAILLLAFMFVKRKEIKRNILRQITDIIVFAVLILFFVFYILNILSILDWSNEYIIFLWFTLIFILSVSYVYISFFFFAGNINPFAFFIVSIGGQTALVVSAYQRYRTIFCSLLFLLIPIISVLLFLFQNINFKKQFFVFTKKIVLSVLLLLVLCAGIYNYAIILNGYGKNYDINKENIEVASYVRENRERVNAEGIAIVDLIKTFNDARYAFTPLEESAWHLIQYMKYYNFYGEDIKLFSYGDNNRFIINGEYIEAMYPPIIIEDTCCIAIRDFIEFIIPLFTDEHSEYNIEWIGETKTIAVTKGETIIFEGATGTNIIKLTGEDGKIVELDSIIHSLYDKTFFSADIIRKGFGFDYKIEENDLNGYDIILDK